MFCNQCGKPIADGLCFCTNCGAPVQPLDPTTSQDSLSPASAPDVQPESEFSSEPETSPESELENRLETQALSDSWETQFQPPLASSQQDTTFATQQLPTQLAGQQPAGQQPAAQQPAVNNPYAEPAQIPSFAEQATQARAQSRPPKNIHKTALIAILVAVLLAAIAAAAIFILKPPFIFGDPQAASSAAATASATSATDAKTDKKSTDAAAKSEKSNKSAATDAATETDKNASKKPDKSRNPVTTTELGADSNKTTGKSSSESSKSDSNQDNRKSQASGGSYILPESATRTYSASELSAYSNWELYLARNEIYARHGRLFQNADLQEYFNSQPWYHGTISPNSFDDSVLSSTEAANANTIKSVEASRGSSYLK